MYFVFDFVAYGLWVIDNVAFLMSIYLKYDNYLANSLNLYYPFIQAVGVCIFKSSLDPLSNVSALFYLKLVSIF